MRVVGVVKDQQVLELGVDLVTVTAFLVAHADVLHLQGEKRVRVVLGMDENCLQVGQLNVDFDLDLRYFEAVLDLLRRQLVNFYLGRN